MMTPVTTKVLFAVYLVLLTWVVVWKLEVPWVGEAAFMPHPIKLVPFLPSGDAGWSAPLEVAANLIFFVPFGLFLGVLAPMWNWWASTAVFAASSLLFETTQHLLGVGSFDITDVIMNTIGGMLGLGIVALAHRRLGERSVAVMTRVLLAVTAVALVLVAVVVISPLRYAHEPDVLIQL
jgi:glycopeptide antibiotics resistance protein